MTEMVLASPIQSPTIAEFTTATRGNLAKGAEAKMIAIRSTSGCLNPI